MTAHCAERSASNFNDRHPMRNGCGGHRAAPILPMSIAPPYPEHPFPADSPDIGAETITRPRATSRGTHRSRSRTGPTTGGAACRAPQHTLG